MIVEKHSILCNVLSATAEVNNLFAGICEWDDIEKSSYDTKYSWGNLTVTVTSITGTPRLTRVKLTINETDYAVASTSEKPYLNFIIIKTATSVGIIADCSVTGGSVTADYISSTPLKFVLTKSLNMSDGNEEKAVIVAKGTGTAEEHSIHLAADSNTATAATTNKTYTNANITVLQPATCATYTGYCPHVFVPVYQTCESSNSKATVNGSNFYILGGSLYLLDD